MEEMWYPPTCNAEGVTAMRDRTLVALGTILAVITTPRGDLIGAERHTEGALTIRAVKLLSEHGSTRATRYAPTNKIVTVDGKTHVAWLDSISQTMIATYDHAKATWTTPVKVGDGHDNHGGPALTCDSKGVLHIVFGPHHGPFQHARSARPNDATQWIKLPNFGDNGTYPAMACDDQDALHIVYRGGAMPRKLVHQRRAKDATWTRPKILAEAPIKSGYTHFHNGMSIGPDNSLHVVYDIYHSGAAKCAGHMMSRDRGKTWALADGSPLDLPVTPKSNAFFKRIDTALKTTGIACDSKGRPWISVNGPEIWHHDGKAWRRIEPGKLASTKLDGGKLGGDGPLNVDSKDRLYLIATLDRHVVLLYSLDKGRTFDLLRIFPPDEKLPHTGLSIERPTGHHTITVPWLLFSTGLKGPDCYGKGIFHQVRAVRLAW
jgi:hypothetical protein